MKIKHVYGMHVEKGESSHKQRERDSMMVACLIHTRGAPQIGFRPDRTSLMAHEISPKISANLRLAKVANVATFDEHTAGRSWRWWRCGKWWQVDLLKKKFTFLWLFTFSNTSSSGSSSAAPKGKEGHVVDHEDSTRRRRRRLSTDSDTPTPSSWL